MKIERFLILVLLLVILYLKVQTPVCPEVSTKPEILATPIKVCNPNTSPEKIESPPVLGSSPIFTPHLNGGQSSSDFDPTFAEWRIGALEKLVNLSSEQRERLSRKFSADYSGQMDPVGSTETVEDILGKESYEIYLTAKERAKARVKSEDLEKEVLFISRRIGLSGENEESLREAIFRVDSEVEDFMQKQRSSAEFKKGPYSGLRLYIEAQRLRRDLLSRQVKIFLTQPQYEAFLKQQSESADVEVEMWHGG